MGICLLAALLALVLRRRAAETAFLLALAAIALVLALLVPLFAETVAFFEELGERAGLASDLLTPLYKTLAISFTVRLGGGLCRDAGESALAAALEIAGSVCAVLVALPLLRGVLSLLTELI